MASDAGVPALVPHRLDEAARRAVDELVHAVTAADGASPLSEDTRLAVAHGRPGALHVVHRDGLGQVPGYLYLGPADDAGDRHAELCVAPAARRHGLGTALAATALAETGGTLRAWAHGDLPAARGLARRLGFAAVRELRLLELDLAARPLGPPPAVPADVTVREFRPGADDEAWLALNARAFAHHPEQGSWTERDLAERMAQPWFDPAGFFLAERGGEPAGFHWTKVHPPGEYGPGPVGEVYVLGIDPGASGRGLGRLLTLIGLRHLEASGLRTVVLYVDGDNVPAVRLYESVGFRTRDTDTLYERRGSG